jgi:hypothetical protein
MIGRVAITHPAGTFSPGAKRAMMRKGSAISGGSSISCRVGMFPRDVNLWWTRIRAAAIESVHTQQGAGIANLSATILVATNTGGGSCATDC